jgi:capsular polysaccharide biosynthesis protein
MGQPDPAVAKLADAASALQQELAELQQDVAGLAAQLGAVRQQQELALSEHRRALDVRAGLTELPAARARSDRLTIAGPVRSRLRISRLAVGEPVALPFSRWMGETECASESFDVAEMWGRLLALEAATDDQLRGEPAAVLDVPDAVVASRDGLHVALAPAATTGDRLGTVAVPKLTYDFPPRKVQNFGHWLLDCLPQVMALATVAPDATFLLPDTLKGFHRRVLALGGIAEHQIRPWDGAPVAAARLLVQDADGRIGRGRPHASFVALRRRLLASAPPSGPAAATRRIYVSRRDAKGLRQWLSNQEAVEDLFRSRGFEILVMAECPLEDQIRIFREARVVAGISGAGLADAAFSPPGTHLLVLVSDSLVRWYASEAGARSGWMNGYAAGGALNLAALGDSPRFYAHLAAACEQYCHTFVGGDVMPIDTLARFVDAVLRRAGAA